MAASTTRTFPRRFLPGKSQCLVGLFLAIVVVKLPIVTSFPSLVDDGSIVDVLKKSRMVLLGERLLLKGDLLRFDFTIQMTLQHIYKDRRGGGGGGGGRGGRVENKDQDNRDGRRHGDETGEIVLDDRQWQSLWDRPLLHFVVCDVKAMIYFSAFENKRVPNFLPSYCALWNETMGDHCDSFPLDHVVQQLSSETMDQRVNYRVNQTIEFVNKESTSNKVLFLDACETVGGDFGVLRSCLGKNDSVMEQGSTACYSCSMLNRELQHLHDKKKHNQPEEPSANTSVDDNNNQCISPPYLPKVPIEVSYTLSIESDSLLGNDTKIQFLSLMVGKDATLGWFFLLDALVWMIMVVIWCWQLILWSSHSLELQKCMTLVPMVQVAYTLCRCMVFLRGHRMDLPWIPVIIAIFARFFCIIFSCEILLLISRGWQITKPELHPLQANSVQAFAMMYAVTCIGVEYELGGLGVYAPLYFACWFILVFSTSYEITKTKRILELQLQMTRQLGIDPSTTPAFTKYKLYDRFGRLVMVFFVYGACIVLPKMCVGYANRMLAKAVIIVLECVLAVLSATMGYTFRCREFFHAFQPLASPAQVMAMDIVGGDQDVDEEGDGGTTNSDTQALVQDRFNSSSSSSCSSPRGKSTSSKPKTPQVVYVMNPDQVTTLGFTPPSSPSKTTNG